MPNLSSTSIKLDDLAAPDDNTDLNASTTAHGLLKKLDNTATNYMNGQGNWAAPAPPDAQYVTLATNATLTVERVATAGDGITLTDGGAGNGLTFDFDYIDVARKRVGFIEEFCGDPSSTAGKDILGTSSGTGATIGGVDVTETGVFGVWGLETGTTAAGTARAYASANIGEQLFSIGQGITTIEAKIKTPASLSDGTDTYKIIFGFLDDLASATIVDGVYFEYIHSGSTAWRYCTSNDSVRTETASSTTVATNTWYRLKIVINAAASSVEYFINGTSAGTISTNLPTTVGSDEVRLGYAIIKTVGTTTRITYIDYLAFQIDLTTPR